MPLLCFIKACNWWNSDRMGTSRLIIQRLLCLQSNYSNQMVSHFEKKKSCKVSRHFLQALTADTLRIASNTMHFFTVLGVAVQVLLA